MKYHVYSFKFYCSSNHGNSVHEKLLTITAILTSIFLNNAGHFCTTSDMLTMSKTVIFRKAQPTPVTGTDGILPQNSENYLFNPNITFYISLNKYIKLINSFGLEKYLLRHYQISDKSTKRLPVI